VRGVRILGISFHSACKTHERVWGDLESVAAMVIVFSAGSFDVCQGIEQPKHVASPFPVRSDLHEGLGRCSRRRIAHGQMSPITHAEPNLRTTWGACGHPLVSESGLKVGILVVEGVLVVRL
jgi:hypothetical protein